MTKSESESRWPSQDGVDRSDAIALIARIGVPESLVRPIPDFEAMREYYDLDRRLREENQFGRAVTLTVREVLGTTDTPEYVSQHYQIGPMSQGVGPETIIVTIWEHRYEIAAITSLFVDSNAIVNIVRGTYDKLRTWVSANNYDPSLIVMTFPPEVLGAICEQHVKDAYRPAVEPVATWLPITTEFFAGYRSPAHPTGDMEYLVEVNADDSAYLYHVNGEGTVLKHDVRQGRTTVNLDCPVLVL